MVLEFLASLNPTELTYWVSAMAWWLNDSLYCVCVGSRLVHESSIVEQRLAICAGPPAAKFDAAIIGSTVVGRLDCIPT